jgi:hypothetical protein
VEAELHVITAVVAVIVVSLALALVIMVARDPGPPPSDVALAYEHAWDTFDFASLWALSGDELRDGQGRKDFVAAKQAAYAGQARLGHLARSVTIEAVRTGMAIAVVRTRVDLRDGGVAHNEVHCAKRAGRWVVVEYRLRSDAPPAAT